jgi:hypothetical protein
LLRTIVLVVLTALISNAQCYGNCLTAECAPAEPASSDSCHHHHDNDNNAPPKDGMCPHQHASFAGPESGPGLTKAAPASTPFVSDLPVVAESAAYAVALTSLSPHSGSPPPRAERASVSILRI